MHLDYGAVQRHCLDLDPHDLVALQLFKDPIQHTSFGPPIHTRLDGVPITETLGKSTPFAPMLSHVQNRVQDFSVRQADITPLAREVVRNSRKLFFADFHARIIAHYSTKCN